MGKGPFYLQCPDCREGHLCEGPSAGTAMNMTCNKCDAWFNIAILPFPDMPYAILNRRDKDGNLVDGHFEKVRMVHA